MRVCIVHCSIALLQEHESWTMINEYKTRILMCSFALHRRIMELRKLLQKLYWGLLMVKGQPNTSFVFKTIRYYLQNGAALIMGYLNIARATNIYHQVALLAPMCFCLISTPACDPYLGHLNHASQITCRMQKITILCTPIRF